MSDTRWQKTSFSTDGNECIELSHAPKNILLRESSVPDVTIATTPETLRALTLGIKADRIDHPETPYI